MARMIPSYISPEIKSNAEKKIYKMFKDDPSTKDWIVIHSLGIADHTKLIYGEIDFLVIAPSLGIYALEVKGGRIRSQDGIWIYTDRYNRSIKSTKNPFEQSKNGIFSIVNNIKKKCGKNSKLSNVLFGFGVMFPDIIFNSDTVEVEPWQIFDINNGKGTSAFIRLLAKKTKEKWKEKYTYLNPEKLPNRRDCSKLVELLRGDFDFKISMSLRIAQTEKRLVKLTSEQLNCLDQLEDNYRCFVNGPAGTGKTLLALEEARRSVIKGNVTCLFCYNKNLANYIKNYFSTINIGIDLFFIGTFHAFMLEMIKKANINYSIDKNSYEDMPYLVVDAIEKINLSVDKIIIDEAQDLMSEIFVDIIDNLLVGGIKRGKWSFFGDFSAQNIYENNLKESIDYNYFFEDIGYTNFKLNINCRNTLKISSEIELVAGFDYKHHLDPITEGLPVEYFSYETSNEQKNKILLILDKLISQGVPLSDITILSSKKKENSIINKIENIKIEEFSQNKKNVISFCTIYSFKGLENSIILVVDVNSFLDYKLYYVGFSRAKTALYVFESKEAQRERNKRFISNA